MMNQQQRKRKQSVNASESMDVDMHVAQSPPNGTQICVRLKTSDGKYFNFTKSEASCSNALKRMLDSWQQHNKLNSKAKDGQNVATAAAAYPVTAGQSISLQSIDSKVLSDIHQWCKLRSFHEQTRATVSEPIQANNLIDDRPEEQAPYEPTDLDLKFLSSFTEVDLLRIMKAANFLDVRSLFDSCCKFMANRWESMKVEDIRKMYHIRSDFTPEEEAQIIQENKKLGLSD